VEDPDVDRPRLEDAPDPLADELDDRLEVELLGEPGLDLVDDRELAGALVGLGQKPFGLVEEAGVLEPHAHAPPERAQEAFVRLAVDVTLEALQRDHAEAPIAGQDRDAEPRRRHDLVCDEAMALELLRGREPERLPRDDDLGREALPDGDRIALDAL